MDLTQQDNSMNRHEAVSDAVLTDPSTSVGMTESSCEDHKHVYMALSFGAVAGLRGWYSEEKARHVIAKERSDCGNLNPYDRRTVYFLTREVETVYVKV